MVRLPRAPQHPERVCWGCEKLCPVRDLACGNGTVRTPHPIELFGDDWEEMFEEQEDGATRVSSTERSVALRTHDNR